MSPDDELLDAGVPELVTRLRDLADIEPPPGWQERAFAPAVAGCAISA